MSAGDTKSWAILAGSAVVAVAAVLLGNETGGPVVLCWSLVCSLLIARGASKQSEAFAKRSFYWLAAIGLLMGVGIIVRALHGEAIGVTNPIPSWADFVHVPAYVLFTAGIFVAYRRRSVRADFEAWLDSIAIVFGIATLIWGWFLGEFLLDESIAFSTRVVNQIYTTLNLVSVALALRITASPGRRPLSYYLLSAAAAVFLFADIMGSLSLATGEGVTLTILFSPLVYGFATAAVWHPTAHILFRPTAHEELRVTRFRLGAVTLAVLTPIIAVLMVSNDSRGVQLGVLVLGSLLVAAVAIRLTRLMRTLQRSADAERRLANELSTLIETPAHELTGSLVLCAQRLFDPVVQFRHSERDAPGGIQLPDSLGASTPSFLVPARPLEAYEQRMVESLARDAGATATETRLQAERARIHAEKRERQAIERSELRFRALVQNSSDVVAVIDLDGAVSYISESSEKLLGYAPSEFLGKNLEWVAHENDWEFARNYLRATLSGTESHQEHEVRALHANGSVRLLECVITDMRDVEGVEGLVVNVTDVTEKRTLERHLRDAETTDALTLLLNRNAFIREADAAIRRSSVSNSGVAMAIINLDDFRLINEGYGTSIADEVLIELSHRVRQAVRSEDSVARLNGDEFGILMPDGYSIVEAENVIERILEELTEPVDVAGSTIALRATAGLVMTDDDSATGISLLRDADTALDAAKQTNRGGLLKFDDAMGEEVSERVLLRNKLNEAIRTNRLRLAFQPIVDIETGSIVSMEALSRWHDDDRGDIPPNTFIPIAEATGMISELGEWALRTACTHVVEWAQHGFDNFTVSVNMSGHQLREENMIAEVQRVLDETGVDPSRITIEITESVLIDDTDFIAERIRALRELGLRLAIDDFGTGYSSLSYLRRYEFDVLKIDRSFVIPLANDVNKREREIVNAMIKLAQALGAITVAEGIEENEEYAVLRTLGCDHAQGFLFWRPIEGDDVLGVLDRQSADQSAA